MPDKHISLDLLKRISTMLETDIRVFFASPSLIQSDRETDNDRLPQVLHRLVRAFRALPSPESRVKALLMLEALAAEAKGGGETAL